MNAYIQENSLSENHPNAIVALNIIMDRNRRALEMNKKAMQSMYKNLAIFKTKTNDFTTNYYKDALKAGGIELKIFIRLIEFEIRKYISGINNRFK